ncbi:peptidoglycan lytic exotransglycosylase [Enterobacter phage 02_vB_Eclo_IJM]|nr:peptidoglycan lytic exotransglycosylase [Enterobacter phage 02_vB_Eclo_IJM]
MLSARPSVSLTNEFAGPATRLEARETARNVDGQDLSRLPIREGEETFSHQGVKFADVPNEPGSVRLEDGSILIGENPLNPKTRQVFDEVIEPERAAAGVNLGGLTEIGLKLLRSENPEIRGLAADLVRSPTGMQSGASGKIGTTASDVFETSCSGPSVLQRHRRCGSGPEGPVLPDQL